MNKKENLNKKNIKNIFNETYIKGLLRTANIFKMPTFVEIKRLKEDEIKNILKEMGIEYYNTNLRNIEKEEINEKGEKYNPIVEFINKDKKQKVIFIEINTELKKKYLEKLANLKLFSQINGYNIRPNTLIILNNKTKKNIKEAINKVNSENKEKYKLAFFDILSI